LVLGFFLKKEAEPFFRWDPGALVRWPALGEWQGRLVCSARLGEAGADLMLPRPGAARIGAARQASRKPPTRIPGAERKNSRPSIIVHFVPQRPVHRHAGSAMMTRRSNLEGVAMICRATCNCLLRKQNELARRRPVP
jgi:hypothetical protein